MIRWLALALLTISTTAHAQFIFSMPKVEQQANPEAPTLYGEVDQAAAAKAITAIQTANKADSSKPIKLFLQGPGGSVLAGNAVISATAISRRPVWTVIVGPCASMCVVIAERGALRIALPHAYLMVHDASLSMSGPLPHIANELAMIIRIWSDNEQFISKRIGMDVNEYRMHESQQWWLTAQDAAHVRMVDVVANTPDYPAPKE
jgi:ATP-dependent Clp protease protease subunit